LVDLALGRHLDALYSECSQLLTSRVNGAEGIDPKDPLSLGHCPEESEQSVLVGDPEQITFDESFVRLETWPQLRAVAFVVTELAPFVLCCHAHSLLRLMVQILGATCDDE
jgi:hypothetical protein